MDQLELMMILDRCCVRESSPSDPLEAGDWERFKQRYAEFGVDFVLFMETVRCYIFPGDILNITKDRPAIGNDTIDVIYDSETALGGWPKCFVPFYSVGNGDYFCLNSDEGESSRVYYSYHENRSFKCLYDSFGEWIRSLPEFLS